MKKFILSAIAASAVMAGAAQAQTANPYNSITVVKSDGARYTVEGATENSAGFCGVDLFGHPTIYTAEACADAIWFDVANAASVSHVIGVEGSSHLRSPIYIAPVSTAPTPVSVNLISRLASGDASIRYAYGTNATNYIITQSDWDRNRSGQYHAQRLIASATALPSVRVAEWASVSERTRAQNEIHNFFELDEVVGVFTDTWRPSNIRTPNGRATEFRDRRVEQRGAYDSGLNRQFPQISTSAITVPDTGILIRHYDNGYQYERRAVARDGQAVAAEQNARLLSAGITNTNNHIRYSRADDEFVFRGQVRSRGAIVPAVDAVLNDIVIVLNTDNYTQSAGLRWNGRVNEGPRIADYKEHIGTCIGLLIEDTTRGGPLANIDLSVANNGCIFSTNPSSSPIFTITE